MRRLILVAYMFALTASLAVSGCAGIARDEYTYAGSEEGAGAAGGPGAGTTLRSEQPMYYVPPPAAASPGTVLELAQWQLAANVAATRPAAERVLIYTAMLRMAVADVEASLATAQKIAGDAGGYMQGLTSNSIKLRVPAGKFFAVLDQLKALGQTLQKDITAQDVTDEYVDLQLRLRNAELTRDRLLAILEKATTVKETLDVERELGRIREEIERIKGRLAMLDKQIAFSTIEIQFGQAAQDKVGTRRPEVPFPWLDELGVEYVLRIRR